MSTPKLKYNMGVKVECKNGGYYVWTIHDNHSPNAKKLNQPHEFWLVSCEICLNKAILKFIKNYTPLQ